MKILTILQKIEDNQAKLYDFKNEKNYQVYLKNEEINLYQSMLDEANEEELENEETGVLLIFNTDTKMIDTLDNESELF